MHLKITTAVEQDFKTTFKGFDKQLFLALLPPFLPSKLLRFDGCRQGDEVHVQLPFSQTWISLITDFQESNKEIFFVDEGIQLPYGLTLWRHKHRVIRGKNGIGAVISDEIVYKCGFKLMEYLLYPILYLQFRYRRPVYKDYFRKRVVS